MYIYQLKHFLGAIYPQILIRRTLITFSFVGYQFIQISNLKILSSNYFEKANEVHFTLSPIHFLKAIWPHTLITHSFVRNQIKKNDNL